MFMYLMSLSLICQRYVWNNLSIFSLIFIDWLSTMAIMREVYFFKDYALFCSFKLGKASVVKLSNIAVTDNSISNLSSYNVIALCAKLCSIADKSLVIWFMVLDRMVFLKGNMFS